MKSRGEGIEERNQRGSCWACPNSSDSGSGSLRATTSPFHTSAPSPAQTSPFSMSWATLLVRRMAGGLSRRSRSLSCHRPTAEAKAKMPSNQMRIVFHIAVLCVATLVQAESPTSQVDLTPFEPPCAEFFDCKDKFRHPAELTSPKFLYPFEMRRAVYASSDGEAVLLVRVDESGFPRKITVLWGSDELFIREAANALKKARWVSLGKPSVFYYRAVFSLKELTTLEKRGDRRAGASGNQ